MSFNLLCFKATQIGRLTPEKCAEILRFLPIARQMAEGLLQQTLQAERSFVRNRGNLEIS